MKSRGKKGRKEGRRRERKRKKERERKREGEREEWRKEGRDGWKGRKTSTKIPLLNWERTSAGLRSFWGIPLG